MEEVIVNLTDNSVPIPVSLVGEIVMSYQIRLRSYSSHYASYWLNPIMMVVVMSVVSSIYCGEQHLSVSDFVYVIYMKCKNLPHHLERETKSHKCKHLGK